MKRVFVVASGVVLVATLFSQAALAAPSDGGGNKTVVTVEDIDVPIFCDEDETPDLWLDAVGFFQEKGFQGKSPTDFLTVFHIDATFSNADGETWVWRDRGPDRGFVDQDGDFIVTITGRSGVNNVGHVVINVSTDEVELRAGSAPFGGDLFETSPEGYACEVLAG